MNYQLESKIIKSLAILALSAALLTVVAIVINSGVMAGGSGGDDASAESATADTVGAAPEADQEAPETSPTTGTRTHVVEDGDSFYSIARKYDTSISEIQRLNPNIDPQHLTAGIKLSIP